MTTNNKDKKLSIESSDYAELLRHAVAVIEQARTEIARHINGYVSTAYWEIGQMLHERKIESGYGDSVVKRLSADLKERYPKMGVSSRQLWNMKKFYERYAGHDEKVLRSVALLPWSHNMLLLSKGLNDEATLYYAQETVTKGWNRDLLLNAIKLKMYETQALARVDNNFDRTTRVLAIMQVADSKTTLKQISSHGDTFRIGNRIIEAQMASYGKAYLKVTNTTIENVSFEYSELGNSTLNDTVNGTVHKQTQTDHVNIKTRAIK